MKEEHRKVIEKLNEDNKHLNEAHKSQVQFAKGNIIFGILVVIVIVALVLMSR